ncbi:uncharacterized protein N7479_001154 [Penicillium vulpinum]|uniref:uncharacterized protein n=1 Tax=Penicillium vulpinum TaxID=29845 RepID=UPI0025494B6A|nr:uncharacterized protein N7479_001154 [Penicillium vulpinum]KAJ5971236.1 hypothetical protein N7479_001154 [Penicillium vulpinum]
MALTHTDLEQLIEPCVTVPHIEREIKQPRGKSPSSQSKRWTLRYHVSSNGSALLRSAGD